MVEDFALPSDPTTVTFPITAVSDDLEVCVDITIVNDDILEGEQQFTVQIDAASVSLPDVIVSTTSSSATVTIEDNEGAHLFAGHQALAHCIVHPCRCYYWLCYGPLPS